MGIYGNYINENSDLLEQEVLDEGATLDIYKIFKDIKVEYKHKLREFDADLTEGNVDEAKNALKSLIDTIEDGKKKIREIDDSAITSRIGEFGFRSLRFCSNAVKNMLVGGTSGAIKTGIEAKLKKEAVKKAVLASNIAVDALISLLPSVAAEIERNIKASESREYKIRLEMKKNHTSEEEAKKKIGGMYKSEILDNLADMENDIRKILGSLN